jgi:hypothetical protein
MGLRNESIKKQERQSTATLDGTLSIKRGFRQELLTLQGLAGLIINEMVFNPAGSLQSARKRLTIALGAGVPLHGLTLDFFWVI